MTTSTPDPIVLLADGVWHIVEHSRRSRRALCGAAIRRRQAHARLQRVGSENVCPRCLALWQALEPPS